MLSYKLNGKPHAAVAIHLDGELWNFVYVVDKDPAEGENKSFNSHQHRWLPFWSLDDVDDGRSRSKGKISTTKLEECQASIRGMLKRLNRFTSAEQVNWTRCFRGNNKIMRSRRSRRERWRGKRDLRVPFDDLPSSSSSSAPSHTCVQLISASYLFKLSDSRGCDGAEGNWIIPLQSQQRNSPKAVHLCFLSTQQFHWNGW